jgi:hypothetical protein
MGDGVGPMSKFDHAWGRDFAAKIDNEGDKFLAEVIRRIGRLW